jgi:hypothetical protein
MESKPFGRGRRRLESARDRGYLDARGKYSRKLMRAHGLWCWRLRLPMVWFERRTRYSKFGRIHLDMLTTPNVLTAAGQEALRALAPGLDAVISAHEACWDRVPLAQLDALARAVLRIARKRANHEPNRAEASPSGVLRAAMLVDIESWRTISA